MYNLWTRFKDKLEGAYKSTVIWFNGTMATIVTALPVLVDQIPQLEPYVGPSLYKYTMLAVLLVNLGLRFKTNKSLADK